MEKICYVGNALLDYSASCSHATLKKYCLKIDENCEYTEKQTGLIEEIQTMKDLVITPGGSAQNSARVTQWLLKSIIGEKCVAFIGSIGKDQFGELLSEKVNAVGVETFYDIHDTESTGITAGLVTDDNKRTLCARLGAANAFNANYLKSPLIETMLNRCDIIYVEGYFLTHSKIAVIELGKFCKEKNKQFAFNLSGEYICDEHFEALAEVIPYVDILFGNDTEMKALARQIGSSEISQTAIVKLVAENESFNQIKAKKTVIMTCGPDPVIVCKTNSPIQQYSVKKVEHIEDTIGAGDAFVAGYLASLIVGEKAMDEHINFAISLAETIIQNRGCSFPPTPNKCLISLLKNFAHTRAS